MRRCLGVFAVASAITVGVSAAPALAYTDACWGQASAALAQMREMGPHASQQEEPRDGLANLAKYLYDDGVLDAPTLQALGAYLVSIDPDLTVESCMT
jgi:hypothetical protein